MTYLFRKVPRFGLVFTVFLTNHIVLFNIDGLSTKKTRQLHEKKMALVRSSNPNSVPSIMLPAIDLATSNCRSLPGASGRLVTGALLRLLPSVGPFHRFQVDPQQSNEAPHHGRFLLGRVVSAPRARLSPPYFRRTGVDTELGVSSAFCPKDEHRQSLFRSKAIGIDVI